MVDDLAATNLVGVGGDQRVLRLGPIGGDDGGAVARGRLSAVVVTLTGRRAARQRESAGRQQRKNAESYA